ncbi:MAG TPA: gephyrin-like molybdotransferase Glp [Gemmatimonadales bacterium]|nr:gephyrin-like molybdotransferase Glp [Gemmatimonadales bacterium]
MNRRPQPDPLAADAAARRILERVQPLAPVRRPLAGARGLVLAEDVSASIDVPPWDNSAMDGYAARGADLRAGATLRVIEEVPAGRFPRRPVGPGEATRLFTGAPLPDGADTVIRQEDTEAGSGTVRIVVAPAPGRNIRRRGEDLTRGARVLDAGTELTPARLGVLASVAHDQPLVHPAPRVALLASGDEVVGLDRKAEILAGEKIASSNSYALAAAIRAAGGEPVDLGIAADRVDAVTERLRAAETVDLFVTTAGVSVGDHDLVRDAITGLGGEIIFTRVRIRPGGPLNFGAVNGVPWIGLPGNPVSSLVTFELFVRPAIRRLCGHRLPFRRTVQVVTAEPLSLGPPLRHFLRVTLTPAPDGPPRARLTGSQSSGVLTSMAKADALLIVPEDRPDVPAGATLTALVLDDPGHVAEPPF